MSRPVALRALCLLLPALLGGCRNPRVLAFFEPPFWDAAGGAQGLGRDLERAAGERGIRVGILVAQPKGGVPEQLAKAVADGKPATVILAPLLSLEGGRFAADFPAVRFLLVDGPPAEDAAANTVQLQFDRRAAFREAGAASALSAADRSAGPVGKVGVLSLLPAGAGDPEGDAFREGAEQTSGAGTLVQRALPAAADRSQARKAVEELKAEGVVILLLRAGAMAPYLLETLREVGGTAVVDGWASSRMLPEQVFLSVEEDLARGIAGCLDGKARPQQVAYGPVVLVRGEGRVLPAALQERLDHVGR